MGHEAAARPPARDLGSHARARVPKPTPCASDLLSRAGSRRPASQPICQVDCEICHGMAEPARASDGHAIVWLNQLLAPVTRLDLHLPRASCLRAGHAVPGPSPTMAWPDTRCRAQVQPWHGPTRGAGPKSSDGMARHAVPGPSPAMAWPETWRSNPPRLSRHGMPGYTLTEPARPWRKPAEAGPGRSREATVGPAPRAGTRGAVAGSGSELVLGHEEIRMRAAGSMPRQR